MRFIEWHKQRHIEKDTMELATSWYYRYLEKEDQMEKIEQNLINFDIWIMQQMQKGEDHISVAELQKAWNKNVDI